jgi:seryl-tRNA synthetase
MKTTMIDIKHLREHPEAYRHSAQQRGIQADVDQLLSVDGERASLLARVEGLRSQLNLKGKPSEEQLTHLQNVKAELEPLEAQLKSLDERYLQLISNVPNLMADNTPEGGEEANRQEKTWGEAKTIEGVRDHLTLAEANDWMDFERGAKVAGNKFYFLKGPAMKLEMSVARFALDLIEKEGFTLMGVPHLATTRIMSGTGFNPRGDDEKQIYEIKDTDLNLIATAEIPLTGYHADEILDPDKLPLLYVGYSPSYRQEAGAYGKYSKGYYRVHQFNKVEMYAFTKPEDSAAWHDRLMDIEERICQLLEIPYRVVRISAGDLGAPAYKKFDIEYWSPVEGAYRELMSCSNVTDYQARRLNIRTRAQDGKTEFVHTLNGTAMAFSRMFIALLENHQDSEGRVHLPEALQPYYGGDVLA